MTSIPIYEIPIPTHPRHRAAVRTNSMSRQPVSRLCGLRGNPRHVSPIGGTRSERASHHVGKMLADAEKKKKTKKKKEGKKESCSDELSSSLRGNSGRPLITKRHTSASQLQTAITIESVCSLYPPLKSPHTNSVTLSQPTAPLSACSLHERTWLLFYSFFPSRRAGNERSKKTK